MKVRPRAAWSSSTGRCTAPASRPPGFVFSSPVTNAALLVLNFLISILIYAYAKNKLCPGLMELWLLSGHCTRNLPNEFLSKTMLQTLLIRNLRPFS